MRIDVASASTPMWAYAVEKDCMVVAFVVETEDGERHVISMPEEVARNLGLGSTAHCNCPGSSGE